MNVKEVKNIFEIAWSEAWISKDFRRKLIVGSVFYIGILLFYPHFFIQIQKKQGELINDYVLAFLPSVNMSAVIFSLLYLSVIYAIYKAAKHPYLFLLFLWSTIFLSISRIITISFVPLEPPIGLVSLIDPVLYPFYGPNNITKDLFYSGHVGSVFLVSLILQTKKEKIAALFVTVIVGLSLLLQHIHYTIDVLSAPLFVYFVFLVAKKFTLVHPGTNQHKRIYKVSKKLGVRI